MVVLQPQHGLGAGLHRCRGWLVVQGRPSRVCCPLQLLTAWQAACLEQYSPVCSKHHNNTHNLLQLLTPRHSPSLEKGMKHSGSTFHHHMLLSLATNRNGPVHIVPSQRMPFALQLLASLSLISVAMTHRPLCPAHSLRLLTKTKDVTYSLLHCTMRHQLHALGPHLDNTKEVLDGALLVISCSAAARHCCCLLLAATTT